MRRRLLGLAAGFVLGAAVGFVVSLYLDKWQWNPPNGWDTRLIIAGVVGGIAGLLGALFGPPQV